MKRKNPCKYPNLIAEMARNGITQSSLARMIGLAYPTVSRKLTGQIPWNIGEIEAICKILNKNYYELFVND